MAKEKTQPIYETGERFKKSAQEVAVSNTLVDGAVTYNREVYKLYKGSPAKVDAIMEEIRSLMLLITRCQLTFNQFEALEGTIRIAIMNHYNYSAMEKLKPLIAMVAPRSLTVEEQGWLTEEQVDELVQLTKLACNRYVMQMDMDAMATAINMDVKDLQKMFEDWKKIEDSWTGRLESYVRDSIKVTQLLDGMCEKREKLDVEVKIYDRKDYRE